VKHMLQLYLYIL